MEMTTGKDTRSKSSRRERRRKPLPAPNVMVLMNAVYYDLQDVFIFFEENGYRLLVYRRGLAVVDKYFSSVTGAKKSIASRYGGKKIVAVDHNGRKVTPIWSHPYFADLNWLKKIKGAAACH